MPWSSQGGGGGWQSGGGGSGPWGRSPGGGGGRRGGGGQPPPPDLEEMLRRGQDRFRRWMPGLRGGRGLILLLLVVIGIWLLTGFYRVEPDEQGVVLRWGEWTKTTQPGLNYHLPWPFETVIRPKVTKINRAEIGYRTLVDSQRGAFTRPVPDESLMLTGDENIIDVKFTVFWRIRDAGQFLFNIQAPERTVKDASESAMREVIGKSRLQSALAEERLLLAQQTHELTQQVLDDYGSGIEITQVEPQDIAPPEAVIAAFRDVQAARADQERAKNEAEAYRNDIIPRARGAAERLVQEGTAYKEEVVAKAQGEAARFLSVYGEYAQNMDVVRRRMFLETMEEVLAGIDKVLIDSSAQGSGGVVPYLPLPELQRRQDTTGTQ
ncbi:MAG: FtsH protease activity modulator HflK [Rhodospirillales bacterium]|nr:FtsH protease activity modulator HflK [Rhodospirillales bacterium]MDE0380898.1 FtsH protease activity modulator HflK [Rhodospirillales bacterium]